MEGKLNFEQLKKDTLVEVKNDYTSSMSHGQQINTPMLKILFDFFNVLNDRKKMQKESGLYVNGFVDNRNLFVSNLPERAEGSLNVKVNLTYKSPSGKDEFIIFLVLSRYMVDGKWISNVSFTSNKSTYISAEFMYKKIIYSAISHSNLKGSYFEMSANELSWNKKSLEIRDFSDVFLPEKTMQDLQMFTSIFEKKGELMRYIFAGTPGTGKTEATIAIANILKNSGVTIIKTVVDDSLKEKIELAELLSPSLVIFDDLDLSLGSRSKGGFSRSLGTFLDVMDGTDKISKGVGVIATSNSIDLLDQAASRPGRFDKMMTFDEITRDNVKSLVYKSIKHTANVGKNHPMSKKLASDSVVDFLFDSKQTGSWIFNAIKMMIRKIDVLEIKDYDYDWIIDEFQDELKTIKKIKNAKFLEGGELKGSDNSKRIGLLPDEDEGEDYEDKDYEVEDDEPKKGFLNEEVMENVSDETCIDESMQEDADEMPDGN